MHSATSTALGSWRIVEIRRLLYFPLGAGGRGSWRRGRVSPMAMNSHLKHPPTQELPLRLVLWQHTYSGTPIHVHGPYLTVPEASSREISVLFCLGYLFHRLVNSQIQIKLLLLRRPLTTPLITQLFPREPRNERVARPLSTSNPFPRIVRSCLRPGEMTQAKRRTRKEVRQGSVLDFLR